MEYKKKEREENVEEDEDDIENSEFYVMLITHLIILGVILLYPWTDCDSKGRPSYYHLNYRDWIFGFFVLYCLTHSR